MLKGAIHTYLNKYVYLSDLKSNVNLFIYSCINKI